MRSEAHISILIHAELYRGISWINLIQWEAKPADESVLPLKVRGIKSVIFQPLGNRPEQGDFMSIMQENLENPGAIYAE